MRHRCGMAGALVLAWLLAGPAIGSALAQDRGPGYLGVYLTGLSDGTRKALGLEEEQGVLVERVIPDSAAEKAGLQPGDVLLSLDGREVNSSSSLGRALDRAGAGKEVEIEILRNGKRQTVEGILGDRSSRGYTLYAPRSGQFSGLTVPEVPDVPDVPDVAGVAEFPSAALAPLVSARAFAGLRDPSGRLGLRTTELTGQLAEYFDVARGLLVTWVVPDSPAGRGGVKAGDILVTLDGQPIGRQEDLAFILGTSQGEENLVLEIVRRGKKESLPLEL